MLDFFSEVQSFIKLDSVCIDNNVFRLHYKVHLEEDINIFGGTALMVAVGAG